MNINFENECAEKSLAELLGLTWGITYKFEHGSDNGQELFCGDGRSMGRWQAPDAGREFLGWQT